MLACHAGGPGSIPGRCNVFVVFYSNTLNVFEGWKGHLDDVMYLLAMLTFRVGQLAEWQANNLWVAGSNIAPVLLFISFVEFYKCIFGAMLQILILLTL